jgi:hypothetical protein
MWSWLVPRGCMLLDPKNEGEAQDAILIRYGVAWIERKRELNGYEAFSLEVPDHATARLMQRAPNVNLPRVLMEAQDQFFRGRRCDRQPTCRQWHVALSARRSWPLDLPRHMRPHSDGDRVLVCASEDLDRRFNDTVRSDSDRAGPK